LAQMSKKMFKADNLYVLPSKSGKLTKEILQKWLKDVYFPSVPDVSVLILDSWSAQNEENILYPKPENKEVVVKTIPAGTTPMVQPLDVFGFRIWKQFVRFFNDLVLLHDLKINIHLRNNLLKIQSIAHNQLSSPQFYSMWKYSWYKCGYVDSKPNSFVNPVEYCFKDGFSDYACDVCEDVCVVARCAWCTKTFCIGHFFETMHYCKQYNE